MQGSCDRRQIRANHLASFATPLVLFGLLSVFGLARALAPAVGIRSFPLHGARATAKKAAAGHYRASLVFTLPQTGLACCSDIGVSLTLDFTTGLGVHSKSSSSLCFHLLQALHTCFHAPTINVDVRLDAC